LTSTAPYQIVGLESGGKMTFCERGLKPVDLPNIQIVNFNLLFLLSLLFK